MSAARAATAFALVALVLAGCAIEPRGPAAGAASLPGSLFSARRSAADELAGYLARLGAMDAAALAAEARRQLLAARAEGDLGRLKAAAALLIAPGADEARVPSLLEPVAGRAAAGREVRGMASFLLRMAAEHRELREQAAAANGRLRDERHATQVQKQRADALEERAADLQQKLDALSRLEKSLSDREPTAR